MATFTGTNAIDEFRRYTQDSAAPYRVDAAAALNLVNQAQRLLFIMQPEAFTSRESVNLVAGCRQAKPHPKSRICRVVESHDGRTVTTVSKMLMDSLNTNWMNDTANNRVEHQVEFPEDNENFYIYPPQTGTPTTAVVVSDVHPTALASAGDILGVEDKYFLAIPLLMGHLHYSEDAGTEANKIIADKFKTDAMEIIAAR